jgi:hypothetical protein
VEWEAVERKDGTVGVVCPGCITIGEQHELDEEDMALAEGDRT